MVEFSKFYCKSCGSKNLQNLLYIAFLLPRVSHFDNTRFTVYCDYFGQSFAIATAFQQFAFIVDIVLLYLHLVHAAAFRR